MTNTNTEQPKMIKRTLSTIKKISTIIMDYILYLISIVVILLTAQVCPALAYVMWCVFYVQVSYVLSVILAKILVNRLGVQGLI